MMKRISRATLRGEPLNEDCKRANRTTHQYGKEDNRVYCYGLCTEFSNCDVREECLNCGAYVYNATPLKEWQE